jgi:hypothetical protein
LQRFNHFRSKHKTRVAARIENARSPVHQHEYGNDVNIHFDCPLPKLLKRLFTSYSFMFLGCSLSADRTIQTFMRVAQQEGQDNLPHHYALLSCPADHDKRQAIDQRLADAHITPLWYPDGEHEHVEQILELLLD